MEHAKGKKRILSQKMITLFIILIVIVAVFGVLSGGSFLAATNIRAILSLMSVTGLLALGVGCLIISGNIDLSTGANGTMCGVMMAVLLRAGLPWPAVAVICIGSGILIGAFNAMLVNVVGFQPFIASMAVSSIAQGISYVLSDAKPIPVRDPVITYIGTGRIFDVIPVSILILVAGFVIYGLMLSKSKFGRSIYLIGGNRTAARLSGLYPTKMSYTLFMNSGMLAALAGMLLASRLKTGTVDGIIASQFAGMTAAMLGGISFGGGSGSFGGVFVGLLIINSFNNGLTVMGVLAFWQTFFSGALLIIALTVDYFNGRRMNKVLLASK